MRRPVVVNPLVASFGLRTDTETATECGARRERRVVVGVVPDGHERVGRVLRPRGRWDAAAREIRYPDVEPARRRRVRTKSPKGDDDDDAIPMGFGVGHPSFKAAFPESASWDN